MHTTIKILYIRALASGTLFNGGSRFKIKFTLAPWWGRGYKLTLATDNTLKNNNKLGIEGIFKNSRGKTV